MQRSDFLGNRLEEVLLNGDWIANTNYKQQIQSVTWQDAVKSIQGLNSIAALTYHINYYLEGILQVFRGGTLAISDQYSFDLPSIRSNEDWQHLINRFINNANAFIDEVKKMQDTKFDEIFVDPKYGTYLRNIEGVIEHSYYHLGQISLVRKLLV